MSRLFILIAILICLPLQGVAAATLPCCQSHDDGIGAHSATANSGNVSHCDRHHGGDFPSGKAPCDKCFACFLGTAHALIPLALPLNAPGTLPMVAGVVKEFQNPIPVPLFHPPRSKAA